MVESVEIGEARSLSRHGREVSEFTLSAAEGPVLSKSPSEMRDFFCGQWFCKRRDWGWTNLKSCVCNGNSWIKLLQHSCSVHFLHRPKNESKNTRLILIFLLINHVY